MCVCGGGDSHWLFCEVTLPIIYRIKIFDFIIDNTPKVTWKLQCVLHDLYSMFHPPPSWNWISWNRWELRLHNTDWWVNIFISLDLTHAQRERENEKNIVDWTEKGDENGSVSNNWTTVGVSSTDPTTEHFDIKQYQRRKPM